MLKSNWSVGQRDAAAEQVLQRELGIPSIVAALLVLRGMAEPEEAHKFLNPSLDDLLPPQTLPDYTIARDLILEARDRKDLIYIHGDYDVDGVTSSAILNRFLSKIGCVVFTHVPHRMKEGYGIHRTAVEEAIRLEAKVFLTCDCGISAHEQVEMARQAGMKVIVTDHHSIGPTLPNAHAVVNPHRKDSQYAYPEISGAGVVFKLCLGICDDLGIDRKFYFNNFLDLAALGTIADVMPLREENRIIAKFGLERLSETKKIGLRALLRVADLSIDEKPRPINSGNVGFQIGPRLNAAGRLDDSALALQLLLETDEMQADLVARRIDAINTLRKAEQNRLLDEAVATVMENGWHERNVIVVGGKDWHSGIVGIVAGKLVETFHRPAFVMHIDESTGVCKGSARTIPGFHLANAIRAHEGLFLGGGGHAAAAGCTFRYERFEEVARTLHEYASGILKPEDLVPSVRVDLEVTTEEVTMAAVEALSMLEPFGCENPTPLMVARGVTFAQIRPTRSPQHVQLVLRQGQSRAVDGIVWGMGERVTETGVGAVTDLLFEPLVDDFRGYRSLKWRVRDYVLA